MMELRVRDLTKDPDMHGNVIKTMLEEHWAIVGKGGKGYAVVRLYDTYVTIHHYPNNGSELVMSLEGYNYSDLITGIKYCASPSHIRLWMHLKTWVINKFESLFTFNNDGPGVLEEFDEKDDQGK